MEVISIIIGSAVFYILFYIAPFYLEEKIKKHKEKKRKLKD